MNTHSFGRIPPQNDVSQAPSLRSWMPIDGVSAIDVDETGEALSLAVARAYEVDAITTITDEGGSVVVDVTAAIGGALMLVQSLLVMLESGTGHDGDFILAEARGLFDRNCRNPDA